MELSSNEEGEIPLPINSTYGGGSHGHMIHHDNHNHHHHHHHHHNNNNSNNNMIPSSVPQIPNTNGPSSALDHIDSSMKKLGFKYRECLKNHAAAMGGNATDGCGEFMPSGQEGTIEALTCSACNCHRNFHRKELEGEVVHHPNNFDYTFPPHFTRTRKVVHLPAHPKTILEPHHHPMIMSYNMPSESDEQEEGGGVVIARPTHHHHQQHQQQQLVRKRFRTKFSVEQKEKMFNFAEKVGWKIQKQEESVVQQFCQEIGVKRRVLKVWMHNNKHNLAKKINTPSLPPPPAPT